MKKQPKQRPRNSALRSTVAFDNGLGAGACGRKTLVPKKRNCLGRLFFFVPPQEKIFLLSHQSLSFLFHLFSKKMIEPLFNLSLSLCISIYH